VGAVRVVNEIATAHLDATLPKQSFEDKCVPKLELGNEGSLGNERSLGARVAWERGGSGGYEAS
jgi:hypothetical protein